MTPRTLARNANVPFEIAAVYLDDCERINLSPELVLKGSAMIGSDSKRMSFCRLKKHQFELTRGSPI